jgi:hypothetical protein
VVFMSGECRFGHRYIDPAFLQGFDILMFDRYPFYLNLTGFDPYADAHRVAVNCVRSARDHEKSGPIMVLQGFGKGVKDGAFAYRDPTYQESLRNVQAVTSAGVRDILFWNDRNADHRVWTNIERIVTVWHDATTGA